MSQQLKGTCFSALAAVIYGLTPLLSLNIYSRGGDALSVVCIRSFIAMLVCGGLTIKKGVSLSVTKKELFCLILAAVFGITCTDFFLGQSYNYISGGLATTLHFVYPAACVVVEAACFKEKVTACSIGSLACVMVGIAMFSWRNAQANFLGVGLALLSGFCYTFYLVMAARSRLKEMDVHKLMFYICCIETAICGTLALKNQSFGMDTTGWLLTVLLAVLVNVIGCSLLQLGVRLVGLSTASMLSTLEPLTSVIVGILVFKDVFGAAELCGCMLVCVGIAVLMRHKI